MINSNLSFGNFQEREVNGVQIYSISNVALGIYRKEARNDANIDRNILERKLTAMIMSSNINNKLNGKDVYRFGGFVMMVNENTKKIEVVSWLKDNHSSHGYITDFAKKLKANYKLLGLNSKGNNYKKELVTV